MSITITPEQSPGRVGVYMRLGPHFYSRVFKEGDRQSGNGNAAAVEKYKIELSATGLGMIDPFNDTKRSALMLISTYH